jgi:ligand-binding sensor domain-containing protein
MKRFFGLFMIFTSLASLLTQCEKSDKNSEPRWTTYITEDGLISNNVLAIAIDKEDNKWFGTDAGVSKFDGATWTNYSILDGLKGNLINSIAIDKEGNKWFGIGKAYSGDDYCCSGVTKFDDTNWTSLGDDFIDAAVTVIVIDHEGNKWFAFALGTGQKKAGLTEKSGCWHPYTWGYGVSKFDGSKLTHYCTDYDGSPGLYDNAVISIAIDHEGNKWFGDLCGITKFDDTNWTNYTYTDGFIGGPVNAIAIDYENNIWFGTCGGVSKFDGTSWTNYTTSEGLVNNLVHAITIDLKGNKWFGTEGGISKFDGTRWTNYISSENPGSNNIMAIAIDARGNKWFGTFGGGILKLSD